LKSISPVISTSSELGVMSSELVVGSSRFKY
jgi:hypothetical protein